MAKNGFRFAHLEEEYDDAEIMGSRDIEFQPQSSFPNANDFVPQSTSIASKATPQCEDKPVDSLTNECKIDNQTFDAQMLDSRKVQSTQIADTSQSNFQVQYADGKVSVMQDMIVLRPDGTQFIDTKGIPVRWSEYELPLRKRRLLLTKIVSIAAIVLFFPTGIPAAYFAFRAEKELQDGIDRSNVKRAIKFSSRSLKFIIMSVVMSVVVIALIITIINKPDFTNIPKGTLVG